MMDVKSLEHPTLKVPYELLNKKFRVAQKTIDREISHTSQKSADLEKCLKETSKVGEMTEVLSGVVDHLTVLKRKAEESMEDEMEAAQACKRRLDHLRDVDTMTEPNLTQWRKKRMDRLLVEHFLRGGYYNTAVKLANYSNIEDLTNINIFLVSRDIEESLMQHETAMCLAWCHDNRSKLRKMKSCLEFELRRQEFIELIRNNKGLEAVRHARKHFNNTDQCHMQDIQHAMGLLASSSISNVDVYKELLDPSRWEMLVKQFRHENFKLYQLNQHSIFTVCLQAGLSALKTPHCYKGDGSCSSPRNTDCPVCSQYLNELAKDLPYAHCSQSRLICAMSGDSLNEYNPPLMLPNGHVYGYKALTFMAASNDGKIKCPRTKEVFTFDQAEKVFVM